MNNRGNTWTSQRAFSSARVNYQIGQMSLRTQEAARAARAGETPNFNHPEIILEDFTQAIKNRQPLVFDEIVRRVMGAGIGIDMEAHGVHVVLYLQPAGVAPGWVNATIVTDGELAQWASERFEIAKFSPAPGVKIFTDHSAAFDYCREMNSPVRVVIHGFWWQLYPSGRAYEQERYLP
jgi:hypothetical protein